MTRVVSFVNLKGGVGKTALATNFAAFCASKGMRTLLIDLDAQTNATFSYMDVPAWQAHEANAGTVADLLGAGPVRSAFASRPTFRQVKVAVRPNLDLVPSTQRLFSVDLDLAGITARETALKRAIGTGLTDYDIVVCDCPPNLSLATQNALAISTRYVVPVTLDYLSFLGVALLKNRIERYAEDMQVTLSIAGIIISRVGRHAEFRAQTEAALRAEFGADVLVAKTSERVAVTQSTSQQRTVFQSTDASAMAEFDAVCTELLARC
jgi:chromosome partitioning protein